MRVVSGLLAILVLAGLIAFQPAHSEHYVIGAPDEGALTYGFWPVESNTEGSYRWSDGESWLRFFGYGTADALAVELRVIGPQGSRGQGTTLRLSAGDVTLLEEPSKARWRTYHLLVPAKAAGWQVPELVVGGTITDAIPGDARGVGVALGEVRVRPLGGARLSAIAEYAAFIALL
ncbi:MAG: hypothetical protein HGA65_18185, partial [Oscillochloris sp.]|nr:hypothetical protein [Oscillochloris sp.]